METVTPKKSEILATIVIETKAALLEFKQSQLDILLGDSEPLEKVQRLLRDLREFESGIRCGFPDSDESLNGGGWYEDIMVNCRISGAAKLVNAGRRNKSKK